MTFGSGSPILDGDHAAPLVFILVSDSSFAFSKADDMPIA